MILITNNYEVRKITNIFVYIHLYKFIIYKFIKFNE